MFKQLNSYFAQESKTSVSNPNLTTRSGTDPVCRGKKMQRQRRKRGRENERCQTVVAYHLTSTACWRSLKHDLCWLLSLRAVYLSREKERGRLRCVCVCVCVCVCHLLLSAASSCIKTQVVSTDSTSRRSSLKSLINSNKRAMDWPTHTRTVMSEVRRRTLVSRLSLLETGWERGKQDKR